MCRKRGNIFWGLSQNRSILSSGADLFRNLSSRRNRHDTQCSEREGEREHIDKDAPFYENTLNARRSSLFPYLLCNTKYTLGIENLHSPSRDVGTFASLAIRTSREVWKSRFFDMFLSTLSAFRSTNGIFHGFVDFLTLVFPEIKTIV